MNSIKEISSDFQINLSESFDLVQRSKTSTKPISQFQNYRNTTKQMKEQLHYSLGSGNLSIFIWSSHLYIDFDIIVIECDISSEEEQSKSEQEDSSSYFKRFNESWIRII